MGDGDEVDDDDLLIIEQGRLLCEELCRSRSDVISSVDNTEPPISA